MLLQFDLMTNAVNRFTEDYATGNDIMASNMDQIKGVVSQQNKMYRDHPQNALRCYINTSQLNRVLAFYKWSIFAVKDAGEEYDNASVPAFDLAWINSIIDQYLIKDPEPTPQSTAFAVEVPPFTGTNWHDVRDKITALLSTRIGSSGIPLTYLIRVTRLEWENTDHITNLQERRIATKMHTGTTFDLDNREFFRILLQLFTSSTLDNLVRSFQARNEGIAAWTAILANVQGASYENELKRQGDSIIEGAFFDPNKNFSIEKYFDKHVLSHKLHLDAGATVPEWKKIDQFMKGIRCSHLQNDYRQIKDDPRYNTFTSLYNKINENYRCLVDQKILKPVSIYKRKISQIISDDSHYSGRGRGRFGRGARRGRGKFAKRGRGARGRGSDGGRGSRTGRGSASVDMSSVSMSILPRNMDLTNLSFSDNEWYNFTQEQRNSINALRQLRNDGRAQRSDNDDISSLGESAQGHGGDRHLYQMVRIPPAPTGPALQPPNNSGNVTETPSQGNSSTGVPTRSSNAGAAFGRS